MPAETPSNTSTKAPAISETPLESQTHRFSIQPLERFKNATASIKRPQEVAHFSFDDDHGYVHDESGINYYIPPPMGVDMKKGFDTFRHYEDKEDAHLDALLKALVDTEEKKGEAGRVKADFVTWRGMMTKVC
jgi:RAT1-interacting protein